MKFILALPEFLQYVDFQSAEKVRSPRTCFTAHTLQNKELLSLKQWHRRIGYADGIVSFKFCFQTACPVTIVIENCG